MMFDYVKFIYEASKYMVDARTIAVILIVLCAVGITRIGLFIYDMAHWKKILQENERELKSIEECLKKRKESNEEA